MKRIFPLITAFFLFSTVVQAQVPTVGFVEKEASKEQLEKLRHGGFVIYMRHGKTDNSRPDQLNVDLNDCNTQRMLNEDGRKMAAEVGKAIRTAKIPIGDIFVSPMCRTRESAQLVFGTNKFTVINELFSSTNQTSEQKKPVIATTRRLLADLVPLGSNRFILAHAPNLADTMGYFPKVEATVVIFIPKGDGFEYVASIRPDMWANLLN